MKISKIIVSIIAAFLFSSCQPGLKKGSQISKNHIDYIKSLGILANDEQIILFDAQAKIRMSGNFFTDRRIAAYWNNEQDKANNFIHFAFYKDIAAITPHLVKASTPMSYLEVIKTSGQKFKVYVKADTAEIKYFFDSAIAEWKKKKSP